MVPFLQAAGAENSILEHPEEVPALNYFR